MTEKNVEIVRRWLTAASADPDGATSFVVEFADDEIDYYPARKFAESEPCHGLNEVSQFHARWRETWTRLEWVFRDGIEIGDDRVLARAYLRAEGRASGLTLEGDIYFCLWLRHGRIFRQEDHLTLSGALHALGLEGDTLEAAGLPG